MQVTNQKPVRLEPVYLENINKDFDPIDSMKKAIAAPLFTPIVAGSPAVLSANGHSLSEDDVVNLLAACTGDTYDATAEASSKEILGSCLLTYNKNTNIGCDELFAVQSGTAAGLPEPDSNVIYTPSADIIPMARGFLAGTQTYDEFFASLAYFARSQSVGFYFSSALAFDNFKTFIQSQMATLGNTLPPDTTNMMNDFLQLSLNGLTESLKIRANEMDNNDPGSFARLLMSMFMAYTKSASPSEFGVLPFSVSELFCPKTIIMVNVEKHARATAREIHDEWKLISDSLSQKTSVISIKKLTKLTATQRMLRKAAAGAAVAAAQNHMAGASRAVNMRFSKTRPTTVNIAKLIKKILDKQAYVNKSMNVSRSVSLSYKKANRREPDNFNKPGKTTRAQYRPDIHLYIDTSGSISERDYEDAVKACIKMAQKLNINLYFNSFSHLLSQTTKLKLENKSAAATYREFQKVPKVSGGTDYAQIWRFINKSKKRTNEISIIITDFEWTAPREFIKHPKRLYYIPCSTMYWDSIMRSAEEFCKSTLHNDSNIRNHVLF